VRVPPNTVPSDTVVGLTEAQLLFGSSAGAIAQSSLLSWDDTLKSLSVTGTVTKVSAAASVWDTLKLPAATITLTGGTGVTALSQLTLGAGTITSASATTVTDAAAVYIPAAPAAGGSVTLTRTFALWVDSGISRLDGQVFLGAATGNATAPLSITVGGTPEALTGFQGTPGVVVFKDGPADFFVGRNVTNNVEVFLGTTGTASATLGTATNHLLAIYTNGTVKFVIGADGTLYGTALHDSIHRQRNVHADAHRRHQHRREHGPPVHLGARRELGPRRRPARRGPNRRRRIGAGHLLADRERLHDRVPVRR
jgi:hypothetical protein